MVDARSEARDNGHDHFFDTFSKFDPASKSHMSQILAEVIQRAADGNVQYLELMISPDHERASALGAKIDNEGDFAAMRKKLMEADFGSAVEEAQKPGRDGGRQE